MAKHKQLLKLTQDLAFKSFFSRDKQALFSLLKNFLPISDTISDVEILNLEDMDKENIATEAANKLDLDRSTILPAAIDEKQIVLDLNVKFSSGEKVDIEMQTVSHKYFLHRILFYWASLYTKGLKKGDSYKRIRPTYSLIFTTFSFLDEELKDYVNSFSIRSDKLPHILFNKDLKIVVVELSKLPEDYRELSDLCQKWSYFVKHSDKLTGAELDYLSKDLELKMAIEHLQEISEDERLRNLAESRERSAMAWEWEYQGAIEEGIAKGREEGMEEVALRMLREGFELPTISKITGLSEEKIKQM